MNIPVGDSRDNDGVDRQTYEPPNCGQTTPHDQHFHSPIGGLTLNCPGAAEHRITVSAAWRQMNEADLDVDCTCSDQPIASYAYGDGWPTLDQLNELAAKHKGEGRA